MTEETVNWEDYLVIASKSDIGMRRNNNQDNLTISMAVSMEQWAKYGHLFVVCDGMGGHAAGELASKLAADHLSHLHKKASDEPWDARLRKSIELANLEIHRRGLANPEFRNMGTTCTSLLLTPQGAWGGHVGDSRLYRLRGSRFEQLTFDHSYSWEMKAAGISDGSADVFKNRIMRSLGPNPEVKVDIEGPFAVEIGDTFLLCSDGLTGPIEDKEIAQIIYALPPDEACETLINLANMRGGPDNITTVIVKQTSRFEDRSSGSQGHGSFSGMMLWSWLVFGVLTVTTVLLGLWYDWTLAVLPGISALIAMIVAISMTVRQSSGSQTGGGTPRGRAPYTHCSGVPSLDVADKLRDVVSELLEVAKREVWVMDWPDIDKRVAEIHHAESKKQLREAIAGYSRLMNRILELGRRR